VAWPTSVEELVAEQVRLGSLEPTPWRANGPDLVFGSSFVCFERGPSGPGRPGERGWAGAALWSAGSLLASASAEGPAGAAYEPGLLALREGPLLEAALRSLPELPDVLLVNATGRDHPRRAGLALHLGAVVGLPTIGVTHRPLAAWGEWPPDEPRAASPLVLDGDLVGRWLRTRAGTRPLAVHAAWRTDPDTAVAVAQAATVRTRTPEPIRHARRVARSARARYNPDMPDFSLTSDAFVGGDEIPTRYTCEGADVSPPLAWSDLPEATKSLALIVDDPDAPGGTFTHWLGWGIDPSASGFGEGEGAPVEGRNDFGSTGYRGPCPPPGHGPHRYSFRLHALDGDIDVPAGAEKAEVERALEGRTLAVAELAGTYERR
jgi:deoxyribonuclease V